MFYMDGFPATAGTMDLDMIDLSGVEGIEIYAGMTSIPPEFMTVVGGERCGVIAVWSRPTRPRRKRSGEMAEADLERLLVTHAVYTSDQVDSPARLTSGSMTGCAAVFAPLVAARTSVETNLPNEAATGTAAAVFRITRRFWEFTAMALLPMSAFECDGLDFGSMEGLLFRPIQMPALSMHFSTAQRNERKPPIHAQRTASCRAVIPHTRHLTSSWVFCAPR